MIDKDHEIQENFVRITSLKSWYNLLVSIFEHSLHVVFIKLFGNYYDYMNKNNG
jgi:hypothetical protein